MNKKGFTLIRTIRKNLVIVQQGFTLIELLVVIAIIGILAALVTASFSSSQRQARDTQRKSDLAQYRNSLESYANINSSLYPIYATATVASDTSGLCGKINPGSTCPEDPKYVSQIKAGVSFGLQPQYQYQSDSLGTKYALWAKLENTSNFWLVCSNGTSSTNSNSSVSIANCP